MVHDSYYDKDDDLYHSINQYTITSTTPRRPSLVETLTTQVPHFDHHHYHHHYFNHHHHLYHWSQSHNIITILIIPSFLYAGIREHLSDLINDREAKKKLKLAKQLLPSSSSSSSSSSSTIITATTTTTSHITTISRRNTNNINDDDHPHYHDRNNERNSDDLKKSEVQHHRCHMNDHCQHYTWLTSSSSSSL